MVACGVALAVLGAGSIALGTTTRRPGPPSPPGGLVAAQQPVAPESPGLGVATLETLDHSPAVHLRFPRMGIDSELMVLDLDDAGEVAVPPAESGAPAGWYGRGASPGEIGPTVILGHVDTRSGPGVFYGLGASTIGDAISVERLDGLVAHYEVTRVASYPQSAFPTDEVYGKTTASELRLITCGGRYDRARGGYQANTVVFATLTAVT